MFNTLLLLAVCVGVGHNLNFWLQGMGVALPQFLTAMLVGIMLTNLADLFKLQFNNAMLDRAGEISLQLFLVLSLMSMQFWLIADAFGPLIIILLLQTLFIVLLAVFVVFRFCGRDYDASVIASGFVGMGMGATPVAMANMHALTGHFGHSPKAFLVVPIVGAFFMDLSNAAVIQLFISLPLFQ